MSARRRSPSPLVLLIAASLAIARVRRRPSVRARPRVRGTAEHASARRRAARPRCPTFARPTPTPAADVPRLPRQVRGDNLLSIARTYETTPRASPTGTAPRTPRSIPNRRSTTRTGSRSAGRCMLIPRRGRRRAGAAAAAARRAHRRRRHALLPPAPTPRHAEPGARAIVVSPRPARAQASGPHLRHGRPARPALGDHRLAHRERRPGDDLPDRQSRHGRPRSDATSSSSRRRHPDLFDRRESLLGPPAFTDLDRRPDRRPAQRGPRPHSAP